MAAEEAGEHVDEFEEQRVDSGLLVSGVLGAVADDEVVPPGGCLLLVLGGLMSGLVASPPTPAAAGREEPLFADDAVARLHRVR